MNEPQVWSAVQIRPPRNHERHCRNAVAFACLLKSSLRIISDYSAGLADQIPIKGKMLSRPDD